MNLLFEAFETKQKRVDTVSGHGVYDAQLCRLGRLLRQFIPD